MFNVFKTHAAGHGLEALLGALLRALHFSAPAPPRGDTAPGFESAFESALAQLECGDWRRAFAQMAALADAGHAPAARIALLMVNRGSALLGGVFNASPQQRRHWLDIAPMGHGQGLNPPAQAPLAPGHATRPTQTAPTPHRPA